MTGGQVVLLTAAAAASTYYTLPPTFFPLLRLTDKIRISIHHISRMSGIFIWMRGGGGSWSRGDKNCKISIEMKKKKTIYILLTLTVLW